MARNKMMLSLFPDVFEFNEELSNEQMGILLRAAAAYRFYGEVYTGDDPIIRMGFKVLASQIDRYTEYCDGKREARLNYLKRKKGEMLSSRTEAQSADEQQTVTQSNTAEQTGTEEKSISMSVSESVSGSVSPSLSVSPSISKSVSGSISVSASSSEKEETNTHAFMIPTKQEVIDYCSAEGLQVDPERFFSYYNSVGWQIGNHPMQDWKAAAWYWHTKDRKENPDGKNKLEPAFHIGTVL